MKTLLSTKADRVFSTGAGRMQVWFPSPSVIVTRGEGPLDAALVEPLVGLLEANLAEDAPLRWFNDWSMLTDYEVTARMRLTDWMRSHRHAVGRVDLFVGSRTVAVGVWVTKLALGGLLHVHTGRETFERELAEANSPALDARTPPRSGTRQHWARLTCS